MKEYIGLIGVVVGAVLGFGLSLWKDFCTEKKQRKKERRGRAWTLLSVIKDARSAIGKNLPLIQQEGGSREIPLSHKADVWRSMIITGGIDFLGSKTLDGLREIWLVLETADGYVSQISALGPQLADSDAVGREHAERQIGTLKQKLLRLYYDNEILARLLKVEEMVEAESGEIWAEDSEKRRAKLVRERTHPKAEDISRTAGKLREGMS